MEEIDKVETIHNIYILDHCINQSIYSIRYILQGNNSNKQKTISFPLPIINGLLKVGIENKTEKQFNISLDSGVPVSNA